MEVQDFPFADQVDVEIDIQDDDLRTVEAWARRQMRLEDRIAELKDELKKLESKLRHISEVELPEALSSAGVSEITLQNGAKIEVKKAYYPSITRANEEAAYRWLEEHGHGSLLKTAVTLVFAAGEDPVGMIDELEGRGLSPSAKRSIHTGQFRAWARRQIEDEGSEVPPCISLHIADQAKIKR